MLFFVVVTSCTIIITSREVNIAKMWNVIQLPITGASRSEKMEFLCYTTPRKKILTFNLSLARIMLTKLTKKPWKINIMLFTWIVILYWGALIWFKPKVPKCVPEKARGWDKICQQNRFFFFFRIREKEF